MMEFEELMDKKELYSFVATRTSQCRILVAGDVMGFYHQQYWDFSYCLSVERMVLLENY